ncbi:MAG: cytochrome b6-f complex iron-sulfur subunit [Desulfobacteraceae bacterium Eth-SRB2]|nr:MAG: cytochrome b6-f complex iron-sulfur subunit [Desulfobacteraceae bacterium Eth-SRB2]
MPEKQENLQNSTNTSRRSFFNKLWIFLGFVAFAEFISVVGAFLLPRKRRIKTSNFGPIIEAGPVEKFPLDSVTAFIRGKFYLSRLEDGGFLALSRKCTHLGCTIPWISKEKNFACPCHSSAFDIRGEVISPPAPRALDIYHVFIENNIIKVDTGKKIKRTEFRSGQVTYPKKKNDRITG